MKIPCSLLPEIWIGVTEISDARHDLDAYVLISRMYDAVQEWLIPWNERAQELVERHAGEGAKGIGPGHPNHAAFLADPEAQEHWGREVEIEVEPVPWSLLKKAEGLKVSHEGMAALRHVGLVIDDEKKPPKKPTKRRKKS